MSWTLSNSNYKYQRSTPSGCKNIGIRKTELVTKTQFLYEIKNNLVKLLYFCDIKKS